MTSRRTIIIAVVYFFYSIVCTQLPLFNTLGYEFSALTGIFVAMITVILHKPWCDQRKRPGKLVGFYFKLVSVQLILLSIPFIVLMINAYFVRNCSLLTGALFFILIPVMTIFFTTALTIFLYEFFKRYIYLAYYLILLILLLHPFLVIFSQPQLYAYNHLFGMFIGLSWDEAQPPFNTLLLYRVLTLAYSAMLLCVASVLSYRGKYFLSSRREKRNLIITSFFSLLIIIGGLFFSDEFGFSTSYAFTKKTLGASVHSDNFDIYYSPDSFSPDEIQSVIDEHEFRLSQVTRYLNVRWSGRIQSFIYPLREIKRRLLGSETSQIARPWMKEIHLSQQGWQSSLKHELVHVVAGSFAPYIIKAPVFHYYGLTEGLAMAIEWDYGNRTLHQYAAAMRAYKILPSLTSLITTRGFLNNASSLSYVASGSFCRWLIEEYGIEKMKHVYESDDLTSVLNENLESLEKKWWNFLDTVKREQPDEYATKYLFTGQPIFKKVCARVLTEIHRDANAALRKGNYDESLLLFKQSESMSPNLNSKTGIAFSYYQLRHYDSLYNLISLYHFNNAAIYYSPQLNLWWEDARWFLNRSRRDSSSLNVQRMEAIRVYQRLADESITDANHFEALLRTEMLKHLLIEDRMWELVRLRMKLSLTNDSIRKMMMDKLKEVIDVDPSFIPARLLLAREMMRDSSNYYEALKLLECSAERNPFYYEMKILRGDILYEQRKIEEAKREYESIQTGSITEHQKNEVNDKIESCSWKLKK